MCYDREQYYVPDINPFALVLDDDVGTSYTARRGGSGADGFELAPLPNGVFSSPPDFCREKSPVLLLMCVTGIATICISGSSKSEVVRRGLSARADMSVATVDGS